MGKRVGPYTVSLKRWCDEERRLVVTGSVLCSTLEQAQARAIDECRTGGGTTEVASIWHYHPGDTHGLATRHVRDGVAWVASGGCGQDAKVPAPLRLHEMEA